MEPPVPADVLVRPWRTATLIASAVAAVELVVILVLGVVLVGKPLTEKMRDAARDRTLGAPAAAPATKPRIGRSVPRLSREDTSVLILNGNGVSGAAHAAASRVRARGYSIGEAHAVLEQTAGLGGPDSLRPQQLTHRGRAQRQVALFQRLGYFVYRAVLLA